MGYRAPTQDAFHSIRGIRAPDARTNSQPVRWTFAENPAGRDNTALFFLEDPSMRKALSVLTLSLLCAGGAMADNGGTQAAIGGGLGGALGNVLGQQMGGGAGSQAIGAGVGAAAGGAVAAKSGNKTKAAVGSGLGAAGGSLVGNMLGGSTGAAIGAGLGGAAGGAIGNNTGSDNHHRHRHH
jgi:hypothetical protein